MVRFILLYDLSPNASVRLLRHGALRGIPDELEFVFAFRKICADYKENPFLYKILLVSELLNCFLRSLMLNSKISTCQIDVAFYIIKDYQILDISSFQIWTWLFIF